MNRIGIIHHYWGNDFNASPEPAILILAISESARAIENWLS